MEERALGIEPTESKQNQEPPLPLHMPEKQKMLPFFLHAQQQRREAMQPILRENEEEWSRTVHERN